MLVQDIKISKIKLGKNSRLDVSDDEIAGLMASIGEEGLLQPIVVVKSGQGYDIVAGNRRFMAVSKLGRTSIAANVIEVEDQAEMDLKNLAENVQRRNISLKEVGRYIAHLTSNEGGGLSTAEIAARLGVPIKYIQSAATAFQQVPEPMRKRVVVSTGKQKVRAGQISLSTVNRIGTMVRKYRMSVAQKNKLYDATIAEGFDFHEIEQYAQQIVNNKDITGTEAVKKARQTYKSVNVLFKVKADDYDALYKKYITNGPFNTMTEVMRAQATGKITFKLTLLGQ